MVQNCNTIGTMWPFIMYLNYQNWEVNDVIYLDIFLIIYVSSKTDGKFVHHTLTALLYKYWYQGGTLIKIKELGSNFFSCQVLGNLPQGGCQK